TSDAFADVPIVWLGVALLTRMMTAHSTRRIKQGDVTDIDAMAAYLPYCDVYGADRSLWKILLNIVAGRNEDRQPRHIDGRNAPKRVVKLRFVLCSPEFASLRLQIQHNAAPCFLSSWIAH